MEIGSRRSRYWLAAPVIRCGSDPLLAGRVVALVVSFIGLCGFYLFGRELFGEGEGVLTAILYVLCPPVLFHNNQFTAETFLFSTAAFLYWAILRALRPEKSRWVWAIAATIFATALLLFKQSGFLLLGVSLFLPLLRLRKEEGAWKWKDFLFNLLLVAAVILCAQMAAKAVLPSEFNATRQRFNSQWVMSARELLQFPTHVWTANLKLVADYIDAYYSWFLPFFVGVYVCAAVYQKRWKDLVLVAMCLDGAAGVILLLRGFNEYLINTAVIVVVLPMLARTGLWIWNLARIGPDRLLRGGLTVFASLMLTYWAYQIGVAGASPAKYIERSTPWAAANYLRGWPAGFGIKEVVAILEKEKRPGVILADAQWGNPRTALEVYQARFPNLRLVPVTQEFLDPAETRKLADVARNLGPARFAIFSADSSGSRRTWQENLEREMCTERTEIKSTPEQIPIVVCRF